MASSQTGATTVDATTSASKVAVDGDESICVSKKRSHGNTSCDSEITSSNSTATAAASDKSNNNNNNNNNNNKRVKRNNNSSSINKSGNNVRVVARIRPLSTKEINESSCEAIRVVPSLGTSTTISVANNNRTSASANSPKTFDYDVVFGPATSQQELYEQTVGDVVKTNVFKGFNVTVMAYGQTGSGKTFTMGTEVPSTIVAETVPTNTDNQNSNDSTPSTAMDSILEPPAASDGIIPRAVYDLFAQRQAIPQGEQRVTIEMSYLEIYNEEARDLLAQDSSDSATLQIRDGRDGVMVQNLSKKVVTCPADVSSWMNQAATKRATASTAMNAVSSRSHAICTLYVTIAPLTTEAAATPTATMEQDEEEDIQEEVRAKLTLVDLAGSERIKRTGAEGKRMKEGININKGLFVLGQCVSSLSELGQQGKSAASANSHIPYRDSKLTRLLQDSLGGNSKTVMVACISPADSNIDESVNTLRYASRTRNIQNAAVRNVVASSAMSAAEAAALRRENQSLKEELATAQSQLKKQQQGPQPQQNQQEQSATSVGRPNKELSIVTTNLESCTGPFACNRSTGTSTTSSRGIATNAVEASRFQSTIASLEAKIDLLEGQQQTLSDEVLKTSLRADRWQLRCERLETAAKKQGITLELDDSTINMTTSSDTDNGSEHGSTEEDDDNKDKMELVVQLRKEIADLKSDLHDALADAAIARATAAAIISAAGSAGNLSEISVEHLTSKGSGNDVDDSSNAGSPISDTDEENEKEEQQVLTAELLALSDGIIAKEAMAATMNKERECMETMRSHFEMAVKSLHDELQSLSAERESLLHQVDRDGSAANLKSRIAQLESRIKDLRQKEAEHKKTLKLREAAENKCGQLSREIQADKKRRANLQKQLKQQSSEHRSEKLEAKKQAAKLMRDANRLKAELQKVKDAAAKQAAVLRRKTAEAMNRQKREMEIQAKKKQQQEERKQLAQKRANAANSKSEQTSPPSSPANICDDRKEELLSWLDREIETATILHGMQEEIKGQKRLLDRAQSKKMGIKTKQNFSRSSGNITVDPVSASSPAMKAIEEEIEMRQGIIEELEKNVKELFKANWTSPKAQSISTDSSCFMDASFLSDVFPQAEAKSVFINCFHRLLNVKRELETVESKQEHSTTLAVNAALVKERRAHEDAILELKMKHSSETMSLLNATKGSIEHSVRLNSLSSVVDPEFQNQVEKMLGSYLASCDKVSESVQGELRDVKEAHEGMKKMVKSVATDILAAQNKSTTAPKAKKKSKAKKKRTSTDSILEEIEILEADDAEEDNSDDSDWSPSRHKTPGPKRRSRRSAETVEKDGKPSSKQADRNLNETMETVPEDNDVSIDMERSTETIFKSESGDHNETDYTADDDGTNNVEQGQAFMPVDYEKLKVKDLREILRNRSLPVSGNKATLINRLLENDQHRAGLTDFVHLTTDSSEKGGDELASASDAPPDKENASDENATARRTSRRGGTRSRGLQNRDLNRPSGVAFADDHGKGKTSKVALPSTPPQSTQKVGGWSTKKIASVRRSTLFSARKHSPSPAYFLSPGESSHASDDGTRRNLGAQLATTSSRNNTVDRNRNVLGELDLP